MLWIGTVLNQYYNKKKFKKSFTNKHKKGKVGKAKNGKAVVVNI